VSRATSPGGDVAQLVRHVIGGLLARGRSSPDIRVVAQTIGTSVRTLQRRLQRKGLKYADVLQHARYAVARELLRDPALRIGDIAQTLGYSDHAHFTRAFQRWTGLTPMRFRAGIPDPGANDA